MTSQDSEGSLVGRRSGRGFRLATLIVVGLISAAVAVVSTILAHYGEAVDTAHSEVDIYVCPMHPSVVSDHPGECPICGMKLVQMKKAAPAVVAVTASSPTTHNDTPGLATIDIDPSRQKLIGLTTAPVERGKVGVKMRTVGRVVVDETRVRRINVKMSGYVERVYADFVGKEVRRGSALYSLYSPDLLAAQEEYLLAVRTRASMAQAGERAVEDGDALVASSRRKLLLWDVSDAEIDRLLQTSKPTKTLTFYSPWSGVVTKKDVVEGMRLEAGAMPYEIVDLSTVWVLADVYENELRHVSPGMAATLTLNAYPGQVFNGKVAFIDRVLDAQTRTAKSRLVFANPKGELRPEMFGEVVMTGATREALRIPTDAVIDSGTQAVVFVALGSGKLEPRMVTLGDNDGGFVEVMQGLQVGELVVTRANFLVDSESRLRSSLAELSANKGAVTLPSASPASSMSPAASPPGHQH